MTRLNQLAVKIFADGADKAGMLELCAQAHIRGLTTNPTLMRKAGVTDYRDFARDILAEITDKPVCFEVLADDFREMERQALEIAGWADNVFVKIPVTNTRNESSGALVKRLADRQVQLNVTAIMTLEQVRRTVAVLNPATPSFVSVFAGRIADTGVDPLPLMARAVELLKVNASAQLIWASSREVFNIFQAEAVGCHAITLTSDLLGKLPALGRDLSDYSLETVKMFYDDARRAGFSL
jgi:transaldolase